VTVFGGLASKSAVTVSSGMASKPVVTVFRFCLKTSSYGLIIWASKSPRRFLGLALKPVVMFFLGLALKPVVAVSSGLASKPATKVSSSLASKPTTTVSDGLALKPAVTVSSGMASKPVVTVSGFLPQNQQLWFDDLDIKITATIFWVGSQNQVDDGLSVAPQNR
jgi:hypothetical protein